MVEFFFLHLIWNSFDVFVCLVVCVQAQASLSESSQRLDLIRHSLELRNKELPPQQSAKAMELKKELESYTASSPTPSGGSSYVSLQPFKQGQGVGGQGGDTPTSSSSSSHLLGKSAAITGKLEVRLMGCQDLLEDVPGRSRRDSTHSAPSDLKSFVKGAYKHFEHLNAFLYFLNGIVEFPRLLEQSYSMCLRKAERIQAP